MTQPRFYARYSIHKQGLENLYEVVDREDDCVVSEEAQPWEAAAADARTRNAFADARKLEEQSPAAACTGYEQFDIGKMKTWLGGLSVAPLEPNVLPPIIQVGPPPYWLERCTAGETWREDRYDVFDKPGGLIIASNLPLHEATEIARG